MEWVNDIMNSLSLKEGQRRWWGSQAGHYERLLDPHFQSIVEALLERACLWPGESALDAGTGTGSVGLAAAGRVGRLGEVFGLDLAPEMVAVAQRRAAQDSVANFQAELGDAEALPFGDETFDVVLSGLTYMLCPEPSRAFNEAYRVLKTPGRLILAVWGRPERCAFRTVAQVLAESLPSGGGLSPFRLSDIDELWDDLRASGFRPAVEALEMPFEYADVQTFFDVHAFPARQILSPEDYQQAADEVAARLRHPTGPLRLTNEVVFGLGYR